MTAELHAYGAMRHAAAAACDEIRAAVSVGRILSMLAFGTV